MSIVETAPKNSLEEANGLSYEDNKRAEELYWNYNNAKQNQIQGKYDRKYRPTYTSGIFRPVDALAEAVKVRRSVKKAEAHYKANESGYQVQAVKDAKAEGYETSFGTGPRE